MHARSRKGYGLLEASWPNWSRLAFRVLIEKARFLPLSASTRADSLRIRLRRGHPYPGDVRTSHRRVPGRSVFSVHFLRERNMLQNWTIRTRLLMLVGVMLLGSLGTGAVSLIAQRSSLADLDSMYLDRVVPMRDLKEVSDRFAIRIVDAAHKANIGLMSYARALEELDRAEAEIDRFWKQYLNTRLQEQERDMVRRIEPGMQEARGSLVRLRELLVKKDFAGLRKFVDTELYQRIDPLTESLEKLVEFQQQASHHLYDDSVARFQSNRLLTIAIILGGLVLSAGWPR